MKYIQAIEPNPNIPCKPGWCLAYVNEAYGVPKKFPTAISAWNHSFSQHTDYDFPAGLWTPLWFSLEHEPAGHVALRAPDGSVYSTTHPTSTTPTRHPSLNHLINTYSFNNPLTYLGWTEDVEGTPVITPEDDMTPEERATLFNVLDKINTNLENMPKAQYWKDQIDATARIDAIAARVDDLFDLVKDGK